MRMQDSKAQEDALRKKIEYRSKNLKYGFQRIKGYRKLPPVGTIFAYQMGEDGLWRFGRYMKYNVAKGLDLIYFYKATSKSKDDIPKLSRYDLLFYPMVDSAIKLAKTGYFVNVAHREVKKEDLLERHIYGELKGEDEWGFSVRKWVDEYGNPVKDQEPKKWVCDSPLDDVSFICGLLGNAPGTGGMEEEELLEKCGLMRFEKQKEMPQEGTIFAYRNAEPQQWNNSNCLWRFGRYMKHGKGKYSLIYLYDAKSENKDDIPKLGKHNLYWNPIVVDINKFINTGYFVNITHREVKKEELLEEYCFWDEKDKWVDIWGTPIRNSNYPKEWESIGYGDYFPPFGFYKQLGFKKAAEEESEISDLQGELVELLLLSYSNFDSDPVFDYNATFVKKKNWQQDIEKTLNKVFEEENIPEDLEGLYALEVLMAVKGCPSEDIGDLRSLKNWVKKHQGEEVPKELMKLGDRVMKYFEKGSVLFKRRNTKELYRKFWRDVVFPDMKKRWSLAKKVK